MPSHRQRCKTMKKVITYGTFDMLHHGHLKLLERAKALGDYFIIGITSDSYDQYRGKLNVVDDLAKRIENVRATGLADEIIVEEYEGQKIDDIVQKNIDIFAIGSDWAGTFDYLEEFCQVVYLERTRGISSSDLRDQTHKFIRFGIVGTGLAAQQFVAESRHVSGMGVEGVMADEAGRAESFCRHHELLFGTQDYNALLDGCDAIYLARHDDQYPLIRAALERGRHVVCEPPLCLSLQQTSELCALARQNSAVLMENYTTLYAPGFQRLISLAKSGRIGDIKSVDVSFTRGMPGPATPGQLMHWAKLPLLPAHRLFGLEKMRPSAVCWQHEEGGGFANLTLAHESALTTLRVGNAVKAEDTLIISGTKGFLSVPYPWWKTEYYELHADTDSSVRKFYYAFLGEGTRYVLVELLRRIAEGGSGPAQETMLLAGAIEQLQNIVPMFIL